MKTKLLTVLLTLAISLLCMATPAMADTGDDCTINIDFPQLTPNDALETAVYWFIDVYSSGWSFGSVISAYVNAGNDPCDVTITLYPGQ